MIGAGPAGLAMARALSERGIEYRQLERHTEVGGIWDVRRTDGPMYESAHFISSRTLSGFSGYPMPDSYPDYPGHRQVLGYLQSFADAYSLTRNIEFGVEVSSVRKNADSWVVTRSDGLSETYESVVVCTGSQWYPNIPDIPGDFTGEVRHSQTYSHPSEFTGRRVLVVGAGNSACDIACDGARNAVSASISMRRGYWFIPKHILGVPADVFASKGPRLPRRVQQVLTQPLLRLLTGDPERLGLQKPDHRLFETAPLINSLLLHHLQHGDITARPGIRDAKGKTVRFTDGTTDDFDLIILATGYRHRVPVAQEFFGDEQHPDLYLSCFPRECQGLFGVGFIEANTGAFHLFDAQAHLVAGYLDDLGKRQPLAHPFTERIRNDRPDLSNGLRFDDSPRHTGYVDADAYTTYLEQVSRTYGWPLVSGPPRRSSDAGPTTKAVR
ncbi:NAD(P)/FAD-dependent oxidoreductase [Streptomyces spongiae]|uniref:NAD(P)/FAD-dependent oxidoreductase n=1 Tax=Streptomyces spongiae TaxID=565072 RepID=A0A5N8XAD8_9ACTN|nr:NAD(P)/FAD-dependent oxidoreductase [Streptomyces spongiae]